MSTHNVSSSSEEESEDDDEEELEEELDEEESDDESLVDIVAELLDIDDLPLFLFLFFLLFFR